jgi:hypothetical protein
VRSYGEQEQEIRRLGTVVKRFGEMLLQSGRISPNDYREAVGLPANETIHIGSQRQLLERVMRLENVVAALATQWDHPGFPHPLIRLEGDGLHLEWTT